MTVIWPRMGRLVFRWTQMPCVQCLLGLALALAPRPAAALQPLAAFLVSAEQQNPDVVAAHALAAQRRAERSAATGRLLPGLAVMGTYTRNEFAARLPINGRLLNIAPYEQLDAAVTLTIPLLDIVSWAKRAVAAAQADQAHQAARQTLVAVAKQIVQQYYQLCGSEGVLKAAKRTQAVSEEQARWVATRLGAGAASSLERAQADSDAAGAAQSVASAELAVALSRQLLETLSGLVPEAGDGLGEVSLHAEAPFAAWQQNIDGVVPAVATSRAAERAARAGHTAASWAYLPSINATGAERLTNASALNGGHTATWQAKLNFSWSFDGQLLGLQGAQAHALAAASAQARKAWRDQVDVLYADYQQIEANRAKSRAARAQVTSASLAETLALEKRAAGVMTQLEVLQVRRDAFVAAVNRISADADLLAYRALLRLDAGLAVTAEGPKP